MTKYGDVQDLVPEPGTWVNGNIETDVIRIHRRTREGTLWFIGAIKYDHARAFVDQVHDLCDAHETKLRQELEKVENND